MMKVMMMNKLKVLSAVLIVFCGLTGWSMAIESVGTIGDVNGFATAKQPGEAGVRILKRGSKVFLNDTVTTARGGRLQMIFVDGSTVRQGENSELVIDEYVFNPKVKKENSASFRITRGIIRVITDKITRLNPERFKVSTNYGTIGIRGCDLMFDISGDRESVIVVELHTADSVVVDLDVPAGPNRPAMKDRTVIREGGRVVEMSAVGGMKVGAAGMNQLRMIDQATKPMAVNDQKKDGRTEPQGAALPIEDSSQEGSAQHVAAVRAAGEASQQDANVNVVNVLSEPAPVVVAEPVTAAAPESEEAVAPPPIVEEEPEEEKEEEKVVVRQAAEPEPEDNKPTTTYPVVGAKNSTTLASGADWSFGAWEQKIIDLDSGGDEVTYYDRDTFVSGSTITGDAFRDVRDGATIYNLSGAGQAAAAILGNQQSDLVQGAAAVNVLIGGGVTPTWSSDITMSGGTSSLAFKTSGSIDNEGALNGSVSNYSLNAFGSNKGAPTTQSVSGNLVGPGTGSTPVTGATGKFDFDHSDGTKVKGVFGSDLR